MAWHHLIYIKGYPLKLVHQSPKLADSRRSPLDDGLSFNYFVYVIHVTIVSYVADLVVIN